MTTRYNPQRDESDNGRFAFGDCLVTEHDSDGSIDRQAYCPVMTAKGSMRNEFIDVAELFDEVLRTETGLEKGIVDEDRAKEALNDARTETEGYVHEKIDEIANDLGWEVDD